MRLKPQVERFYMPELDTLRFFAFLAVFLHHAFEIRDFAWMPDLIRGGAINTMLAGMFGVDLFFLLSSYLITSLLLREQDATGRIDIPWFWIRRCLRIWPLYIFLVVVGAFLLPSISDLFASPDHVYLIGLLTFTQNLVVACSDIGQGNPTLVLWSVSLEEQFYFLWPILIFFAGVKRLRAIAMAMIIISFCARLYAIHLGATWDMLWNATPLRLEPLAAGALIALASNQHPEFGGKIRAAMLCAGIAIPVLCMAHWTDSKWFNAVRFPLVYLGKISYGLYVFHALTIDASPGFHIANPFTRTLVTFVLTVALAAMSYRFLELPFLHLKERFAHIRSRPA